MTDDKKQNPWHLTPKQCACLRVLSVCGSVKRSAEQLGIATNTLDEHLRLAKLAMGVDSTIRACVEWDRYARGVISRPVVSSVFQFRGFSGEDGIAA